MVSFDEKDDSDNAVRELPDLSLYNPLFRDGTCLPRGILEKTYLFLKWAKTGRVCEYTMASWCWEL